MGQIFVAEVIICTPVMADSIKTEIRKKQSHAITPDLVKHKATAEKTRNGLSVVAKCTGHFSPVHFLQPLPAGCDNIIYWFQPTFEGISRSGFLNYSAKSWTDYINSEDSEYIEGCDLQACAFPLP